MKKFLFIGLFIVSQVTQTFSQSKIDSGALKYYKFLAKQQIEVGLKLNKLGSYLVEYIEKADKCDTFIISRSQFDTLAGLFSETSDIVGKAIIDIVNLPEVDTAIGLKEPILFLFRGHAKIIVEYYPLFLSLLQQPKRGLSSEQLIARDNLIKRYNSRIKDLFDQVEVIELASSEFMTKYNFTEYDVLKGGL